MFINEFLTFFTGRTFETSSADAAAEKARRAGLDVPKRYAQTSESIIAILAPLPTAEEPRLTARRSSDVDSNDEESDAELAVGSMMVAAIKPKRRGKRAKTSKVIDEEDSTHLVYFLDDRTQILKEKV